MYIVDCTYIYKLILHLYIYIIYTMDDAVPRGDELRGFRDRHAGQRRVARHQPGFSVSGLGFEP